MGTPVLRYKPENGYGNIDTNSDDFQLGKMLYETQEALETENIDVLYNVATWFCRLVHVVGNLSHDYSCLRNVLNGKAVYEYTDKEGRTWEVKRQRIDNRPAAPGTFQQN